MTVAAWPWATPPSQPRAPHAMLIVFAAGPVAPAIQRDALPAGFDVDALDVRVIARATDPAWFDEWRGGHLREIARSDLGDDLGALDAADHLCMIAAAPDAPADLGYLQGAWAIARTVAAAGAVVLDVHAHTFHRSDALPAAGAPLAVAREVRIVFETTSDRPDHAHALHTRGLRKFGAADVVALCGQADLPLVGDAVAQLAELIARGGDTNRIVMTGDVTWYLVPDRDGLAGLLHLNNDARVLVDDAGRHLVGAAARIAAGTT